MIFSPQVRETAEKKFAALLDRAGDVLPFLRCRLIVEPGHFVGRLYGVRRYGGDRLEQGGAGVQLKLFIFGLHFFFFVSFLVPTSL